MSDDRFTRGCCGETLTATHDGIHDESGHPATFVHSRYLTRLEAAYGAVQHMHRQNPEGIIPTCIHDGEPYPCTTMRMLNPSILKENK